MKRRASLAEFRVQTAAPPPTAPRRKRPLSVNIPDEMDLRLRVYCARERRSMRSVILEGLENVLPPEE